MPDEVSIIRNNWTTRIGGGCFREVQLFLIMDTSNGIIPLIPWSLTK